MEHLRIIYTLVSNCLPCMEDMEASIDSDATEEMLAPERLVFLDWCGGAEAPSPEEEAAEEDEPRPPPSSSVPPPPPPPPTPPPAPPVATAILPLGPALEAPPAAAPPATAPLPFLLAASALARFLLEEAADVAVAEDEDEDISP